MTAIEQEAAGIDAAVSRRLPPRESCSGSSATFPPRSPAPRRWCSPGSGVTVWTDNAALIALAALVGEIVGFYAVLAVTIYAEQAQCPRRVARRHRTHRTAARGRVRRRRAARHAPDPPGRADARRVAAARPAVGLLAGKVAADIVFYAIAAGAFTVTDKTGLRDGRRPGSVSHDRDDEPARAARRRGRSANCAAPRPRRCCRPMPRRAAVAVHGTPVLLLDPERIRRQYRRLRNALPFVRFHYAVKALSHDAVIDALADAGLRLRRRDR